MYTELETASKMKQQQILHVNAIWFPCEDRSTNKQLTGNSALVRSNSISCEVFTNLSYPANIYTSAVFEAGYFYVYIYIYV